MLPVIKSYQKSYQGSKKEPFRRVCSANDPSNWVVEYHRTLVREVKTISKCAMILTVSATSGELIIDGEPVNAAVFKSVSSQHKNAFRICTLY